MTLHDHERKSPLWAKLKEHFEHELTVLRERNDGNLNEIETAKLRGRLFQVKAFLLLETPGDTEPDDAQ